MNKIFISYRRADSAGVAGRIYDHLARRFGRADIVMDVDSIPAGVDFRGYISDAISQCALMIVIIGNRWADILDASGRRRLDDPDDIVRFELLMAQERGLIIVPVQLGRDRQDRPLSLPPSLAFLHALGRSYVDVGASFVFDVEFLVLRLQRTLGLPNAPFQPTLFDIIRRRPTAQGLIAWTWFALQVYVLSIAAIWRAFSIFSLGRQQALAATGWILTMLVALLIGLLSIYSVYLQWLSCLVVIAGWSIVGYLAGTRIQLVADAHVWGAWWAAHVAMAAALAFGFYGFAINLTLFRRWRGATLREYYEFRRAQRRQLFTH